MIWSQKTILMALNFFLNFNIQDLYLYINFLYIVKWTCKEAQACMPVTISLETIDDLLEEKHIGTRSFLYERGTAELPSAHR